MKLYIQHMTGPASVRQLRDLLGDLSMLTCSSISLGQLELPAETAEEQLAKLRKNLQAAGMNIIFDRKLILVEKLKHLVFELLQKQKAPQQNYSVFISNRLHLNYTYLANIFSETQGISLEHFIIGEKIKLARALLRQPDLSLGQIADRLHYSSLGHFSSQFKKLVGQTPSQFRKALQQDEGEAMSNL